MKSKNIINYDYTIEIKANLQVEELEKKFKDLLKDLGSYNFLSGANKCILPAPVMKTIFSYLLPREFAKNAKISMKYRDYVYKFFEYKKTLEAYEIRVKSKEVQEIINKLNDPELFDQEVFSYGSLALQKTIASLIRAKHKQMHAGAIMSKIKYDMRNSKTAPAEVFWKYFCQNLENEHQVEWGILSKNLKMDELVLTGRSGIFKLGNTMSEMYDTCRQNSIQILKNTIDVFNAYFLNQVGIDLAGLVKIISPYALATAKLNIVPTAYSADCLVKLPFELRSFFEILERGAYSLSLSYLIFQNEGIQDRVKKHPDLGKIFKDSPNEFEMMSFLDDIDNKEDNKEGQGLFIKIGDLIISHFTDILLEQFDDSALPLEPVPSDNDIEKALEKIKNSEFSAKILTSKKLECPARVAVAEFHRHVEIWHNSYLSDSPTLHEWIKLCLSKMYINAEIYYVDLINEAVRPPYDYKDEVLSLRVVSYILSEIKEKKNIPYDLLANILTRLPYSDAEKVKELISNSVDDICAIPGSPYQEQDISQIKQLIDKDFIGFGSKHYFYDLL